MPDKKQYKMDVKMFATITVEASSEEEARMIIDANCGVMDCNGGAWPNGDPILFEAAVDGEIDLIEIDGEAV